MQGVLGSRQHAGPSRAPRSHRTAAAPCRRALAARPYGPHRPLGPCSVAAGGGGEDGDGPALDERQMFVKLSIAASTGRLDLSDCRLRDLPPGLWEISDLQELSLAGNHITELPAGVGALRELRRLVVAGNSLRQLPAEIWGLAGLEGLWAHGNHLAEVPADVGALTGLKALSLAGNRVTSLPESLGALTALEDLSLSGNRLSSVPAAVAALPALKRLALNGNGLEALPGDWSACVALQDLHLQGNRLTAVPDGLTALPAVVELSLADNQISRLPEDLSGWRSLQKLHLYGNQLTDLPLGPGPASAAGTAGANGGPVGLLSLPHIQQLWLEGNPLAPPTVDALLRRAAERALPPSLRAVGLDERQVAAADGALLRAALDAAPGVLRVGRVAGSGPGYFKLQRGRAQAAGQAATAEAAGSVSSSGGSGHQGERVLVVAFGSAPGLPNWGGALRQVEAAMERDGHGGAFDVLFVVDPFRDWYHGGDLAALQAAYHRRLDEAVAGYGRVLMVGDSMGATAALLFCRPATAVLAFCPQVDLRTASIRPCRPVEWFDALQQNTHAAIAASGARVRVLTGTWQHDIAQASLVEHHPNVSLKAYAHDSHRLALALARGQKLVPLLQEAISNEAGLPSKNVRLANIL